jgi:hypothetical protein
VFYVGHGDVDRLSAVIEEANRTPEKDTIRLWPEAMYDLNRTFPSSDGPVGLPSIRGPGTLTIDGRLATIRGAWSPGMSGRIFGVSERGTLLLNGFGGGLVTVGRADIADTTRCGWCNRRGRCPVGDGGPEAWSHHAKPFYTNAKR